jgi:hypothetical protein
MGMVLRSQRTETKHMSQDRTEPTIAEDALRGIKRIAAFIDEPERRTQYLLETKRIPAGKLGRLWIASKRQLHEHYRRLTSGQAG